MKIWQCRPWRGSAWSGFERSYLAQSGSVLYKKIYNNLTYLSTKFKETALSCSQVNMVIRLVMLHVYNSRDGYHMSHCNLKCHESLPPTAAFYH